MRKSRSSTSERALGLYFAFFIAFIVILFIGIVAGHAVYAEGDSSSVSVLTIQPPPASIRTDAALNDADYALLLAQRWLVWTAVVMLAISGSGTFLLLRTLQEAKRSADAASRAVNVQIETAERQLRAYLGPRRFQLQYGMSGGLAEVSVQFQNFGQTPATSFKVASKFCIQAREMHPPRDKLITGLGKPFSFGEIQPGAVSIYFVKIENLTASQIQALISGKCIAYWWGVYSYKDAFQRKRLGTFYEIIAQPSSVKNKRIEFENFPRAARLRPISLFD